MTLRQSALLRFACICLFVAGHLAAADATVFVTDFAGDTLPAGISDNTYEGPAPSLAVTTTPQGRALRVAVAVGGFAQLQLGEFALSKAVSYHAAVTLSATSDARVQVFFRQRGAPYATYLASEAAIGSTSQTIEVAGVAPETCAEATLMLVVRSHTIVLISKVLIERGPLVEPALRNGGFEGAFTPVAAGTSPKAQIEGDIAEGWRDDSGWGEVSIRYARDGDVAQSGAAAQRIEVRSIGQGGAQFCQQVHLNAGRIYRVAASLRAAANTRGLLQLRAIGAPYTTWAKAVTALSPEWRRVEFLARLPSDSDGLLMFNPESPGTYWLDDVSFSDVTDSLGSAQPARVGNQWVDGSFEAGLGAGWSVAISGFDDEARWVAQETLDLQPRCDATTAADGAGSLAIDLPPMTVGMLTSPLTVIGLGRTCTASLALRSEHERRVTLSLSGTTAENEVTVGPQWQRFTVSGAAMLGTTVQLRVRGINRDEVPATFWCDAAMLEDGATASPTYLRPQPVELALAVPRPGGIVYDGEAAPIALHAVGYAPLPTGAQLTCTVEDLTGRITVLSPIALPSTQFAIPPDAIAPRGLFKLRAQVVDSAGTPLSAVVERVFARLPRPRTLTPAQEEASYFGAHVELTSEKLAIARATGARWVRLHDASRATLWSTTEVQRGTRVWNDAGVTAARAAGLRILGLLGGAPRWATRTPQAEHGYFSLWNLPDADGAVEQWSAYVGAAVDHYKPWITHWEIWNEPWVNGATDGFLPNGTPEFYGDLLRRATVAVKTADLQATVVGVCTSTGDPRWLERVLAVAGPDQFDAMSFHYYGSRLQGGVPSPLGRITAMLNRAQSAHGPAKPLWDSEGGLDSASWYRRSVAELHFQMASLVRLDVAQLASGVVRFFPYTMHGTVVHGQEELALLEYDRAPKSALVARAVLASEIDGAAYTGRSEPAPGLEAHAFRQIDGSTVQVVWSSDGKPHALAIAAGQHALDTLGNPLSGTSVEVGDEPLYLHRR